MTKDCTCPIHATPAAQQAIERLRADHGDIILHVTGGCCDARTPLCIKASELSLGARDVLLGEVEGVPVYEMRRTPDGRCCADAYLLDVVAGVPVGFSIDPGDGLRFAIRQIVTPPSDHPSRVASTTDVPRESLEAAPV